MKTITQGELKAKLAAHKLWLDSDKKEGERLVLVGYDLSGCYLYGCDLSGCYLYGCDLSEANLSWVDLSGCDLSYCDLRGCNLDKSDLIGSNLSNAKGIFKIDNIGHDGDYTVFVQHADTIMVKTDRFWGDIISFRIHIMDTYKDDTYMCSVFSAAIELAKIQFSK